MREGRVGMKEIERRNCQRYKLNYSIVIHSPRGIENDDGHHIGEILDAGTKGIRLRVANFGPLKVGTKLQIICQPARGNVPKNNCYPVPIEGLVVWEDAGNDEFALSYLN